MYSFVSCFDQPVPGKWRATVSDFTPNVRAISLCEQPSAIIRDTAANFSADNG
jgi:hypothetical protein